MMGPCFEAVINLSLELADLVEHGLQIAGLDLDVVGWTLVFDGSNIFKSIVDLYQGVHGRRYCGGDICGLARSFEDFRGGLHGGGVEIDVCLDRL